MRIIVVNIRYFVSGGPERYLFNIKDILEKEGHEVIPFSVKSERNVKSDYERYFANPIGGQDEVYFENYRKNIRTMFDIIGRLFYSFHVKRRLIDLIRRVGPDIVYVLNHYSKLSPSVIDSCKAMKVPVVVRLSDYFLFCPQCHMLDSSGNTCEECIDISPLRCIAKRCAKKSFVGSVLRTFALILQRDVLKIYGKADAFVCTTEFMKTRLRRVTDDRKIHVIRTLVQREEANPSRYSDTEKDTLKADSMYILYFGRFAYEKAVDHLLFSYIHSGLYEKNIKLKLVGGRPEDLQLGNIDGRDEDLMKRYVEFIDFCTKADLDIYIRNCLFVVHPSRWYENLPNSILEAFSFGKTVITADLGSLPEAVRHLETGLLYDPHDTNDLCNKMITLSEDDVLRRRLERNCIQACALYSGEAHYQSLFRLFRLFVKESSAINV